MSRILPHKAKDMLHIWTEFKMLSTKHNSINLSHGYPGLDAPDFLIENMKHAVSNHEN